MKFNNLINNVKNFFAILLFGCVIAMLETGCAFNAKDQVPGVEWKKAIIDITTNGTTHCEIVGYNSKKDIALTVNPITHECTLGAVMNPANTTAAGIANQVTITANGESATKIITGLGAATGTVMGETVHTGVTGH